MRFVGPVERALFLIKVPFLAELPSADLALIAEHVRERHVKKGVQLIRPDEIPEAAYVVVEGSIEVEGAEHPLPIAQGPEEVVGLHAMLARQTGVRATAEADALVLEFDAELIFDLFEENFLFFLHVLRSLARATLAERRQIPDGTFLGQREPLIEIPRDRPLDLVERLLIMRQGVFAEASLDAVANIARHIEEVRVPAGTRLWRAGDPSGFLYAILDGVARCEQSDGRGVFRAGPGYPLGNLESQCGEPRWYDLVAETDLVLSRGSTERFLDALEDEVDLAQSFIASVARGTIAVHRERNLRDAGLAESDLPRQSSTRSA
jgi:CRP-like cAMP-binding protein